MEIIEERTIGPQLGAENIAKGFNSTCGASSRSPIFMIIYYQLFGFFSVLALAVNLLLLVALAVAAAGDADPAGYRRDRAARWAWRSTPTC